MADTFEKSQYERGETMIDRLLTKSRPADDHTLAKEKSAVHDADLERMISVNAGSCEDINHATARTRLSPIAMVALSFNICNSWVAIATSLAIAISAGGSVTLLYGIICSCVVYASVGISLAEMISVYPTPGGQYHFTSILASPKWSRGLSYICGSISMFSWIALTAAATILGAQMVIALPESFVEGYTPQPWHYFVVYQGINIVMLLYNLFALRVTPWIHNVGCKSSPIKFDLTSADKTSCFDCHHFRRGNNHMRRAVDQAEF
jgi:choline transport protein